MIQPLKILWETASSVLASARYVTITQPYPQEGIIEDIKKFYHSIWSSPAWPRGVRNEAELIMYFLIRDSVNFCFWYGRSSVRPNESSSGKLADILSEQFQITKRGETFYESIIYPFGQKLKKQRFPLVNERLVCLEELVCTDGILNAAHSPDSILERMITSCPWYTSDVFLKRASLFIGEIFKSRSWIQYTSNSWSVGIWDFPVPADYHLPNVLRGLGLITYTPELAHAVDTEQLIPKGSEMEAEIRAATVTVCRTLSQESHIPPPILDEYLFGRRKEFKTPFHLTITTDY